jgi:hypothetical protein
LASGRAQRIICPSGEPVDAVAALSQHLRVLSGNPERGDRLMAGMSQLAADLTVAVPSLLAVSIVLVRCGGEVPVSIRAGAADSAAVLASLAVPLPAAEPADVLVLRAGEAGAFLLLADDLDGMLGPGQPPIEVDRHLSWPSALTGESLAASLADLAAVDQGIGVLLARGLPPEAGRRELQRRADDAGVAIGAASRSLLESLAPPAEPC